MERIDIILIVLCTILLTVTFVMNVIASSRLSKLTNSLNEIESKVEPVQTSEHITDKRSGKETTYITQPESSSDSKVVRYRPPGSSTEGSGVITPRPAMSKSGIKIEAEPPKIDLPEKEESGEEEDVMDVVTFDQTTENSQPAFSTPQIKETTDEQIINPFILKEQRIDFAIIESAIKGVSQGGSLTLNMADVPLMIESERLSFKKVIVPALESGIKVVLLNADAELKTMLNEDVSGLTYV